CSLEHEPWLRRLGNRLFFPARSPPSFSATAELWFTDGTVAGSGRLLDTCPLCVRGVSRPRLLRDRIYFLATSEAGRELWSSDGTAAGTRQVSNFEHPEFDQTFPLIPIEVAVAGGRTWFAASQSP